MSCDFKTILECCEMSDPCIKIDLFTEIICFEIFRECLICEARCGIVLSVVHLNFREERLCSGSADGIMKFFEDGDTSQDEFLCFIEDE